MIRRWSCLTDYNVAPLSSFNLRFDSCKFLRAVNYKNFSIGLTKFKRPKLARRKRNSSWLIYTIIFKYWIKDYNFFKKIVKSQFFESIFTNNVIIYNFNYIKKKNILNETFNFDFLIHAIPKCFFFYFYKKYFNCNVLFFLKAFKNTNFVLANFPTDVAQFNEKIIPFAVKAQNNFYAFDYFYSKKTSPLLFLNNLIFLKILNIYKSFIFFLRYVKLLCLLNFLN